MDSHYKQHRAGVLSRARKDRDQLENLHANAVLEYETLDGQEKSLGHCMYLGTQLMNARIEVAELEKDGEPGQHKQPVAKKASKPVQPKPTTNQDFMPTDVATASSNMGCMGIYVTLGVIVAFMIGYYLIVFLNAH